MLAQHWLNTHFVTNVDFISYFDHKLWNKVRNLLWQEVLYNFVPVEVACSVEGRGTVCIHRVDLCSSLQQQLDDIQMTSDAGRMKRGASVVTVTIYIGSCIHKATRQENLYKQKSQVETFISDQGHPQNHRQSCTG